MRILLAQIDTIVGDLQGNLDKCLEALREGQRRSVDLVLAPELTLVGYPPRDLCERRLLSVSSQAALQELVQATRTEKSPALLVGGLQWHDGEAHPRNVAHLVRDGRVDSVAKRLLPTYDVFDEARHFSPGHGEEQAVFEVAGVRIGVLVCEDMWTDPRVWGGLRMYGADPSADLAAAGAEVICNLSASPFHAGKLDLRAALCSGVAVRHRVGVLYCNLVGGNDSLIFDGSSMVVSADGSLAGLGPRFAEGYVEAIWSKSERRFTVVEASAQTAAIGVKPAWDTPKACAIRLDNDELDEIEAALTMGVSGYVRKLGFRQATLGLSGGIDSALVAYLAAVVLGGDSVLAVEMPSRYTAQLSRDISKSLIDRLGLRQHVISIEGPQEAFLGCLAPIFANRPPDVTEENLQARIRGTLLMGISNKLGPILLSTGNKSEMAVGYCTLYGDMNGGLSVISDLFKLQIYALCRRINERAGEDVIPRAVITRPPSAELRDGQTDQDSLPPYEVLDPILAGILEDQLEDDEIFAVLSGGGARKGPVPDASMATIRRVRQLTQIAEFKRHQAAPTLRVSRKAWHGRRYPIVQRFRGFPTPT